MFKRFLLVVLLWAVAFSAFAAPRHVVLVLGDSLSAAYGIDTDQGWVNLLQERLKTQHYDYTVVNASISGETTGGGLTRLPEALQRHHPAVVVLELGANDGLRGLPWGEMHDNLAKMIVLSRKAQARVLLVGMLLPPNFGPDYVKKFSGVYSTLATQYKVPLVPFLLDGVAQHRELMQPDGLHPLAGSEPRVLDNLWPYLKPLLQAPVKPAH